jgi:hypothetical protein
LELEEHILPKLRPAAEKLKIVAVEWLSDRNIETLESLRAQPPMTFTVNPIPPIDLRGQALRLAKPSFSLSDLAAIMEPCFMEFDPVITTRHVFAPVDDALRKAGLAPEDLEAVLFIGGSSANPLVRSAVMRRLPKKVKAVVPQDLRSHVSAGAALHSLGFHGYGIDFITPITSEPISLLTTGHKLEIIIPAATETPCPAREIRCRVGPPARKVVELPICAGDESKLLGILRLEDAQGFQEDQEVKVQAAITHDKLLAVEAMVGQKNIRTVLLNPLANKSLGPLERRLLEAKQRFNVARLANNGKAPFPAVLDYANSAWRARNWDLAAQMFSAAERLSPGRDYATTIFIAWLNLGQKKQAEHWARLAYKRTPSCTTAYNLSLMESGDKKEILLNESLRFDPKHGYAAWELGNILDKKGDPRGLSILKDCLANLERKLEIMDLTEHLCGCLIKLAKRFNRPELAAKAEAALPSLQAEQDSGDPGSIDFKNLVWANARPALEK